MTFNHAMALMALIGLVCWVTGLIRNLDTPNTRWGFVIIGFVLIMVGFIVAVYQQL